MACVRTLPCSVAGELCQGDIAAHHIETGGMSSKATDLFCIALCGIHHAVLHAHGKTTFESTYGVDLWRLNRDTMRAYIEEVEG